MALIPWSLISLASILLPALAAAFSAYLYARRRRALWLIVLLADILYGPWLNIVIQRGPLWQWEMLIDHLVGMFLLSFIAALAYTTARQGERR